MTAAHHPQSDGQTERAIQSLLRLIRTFSSNFLKNGRKCCLYYNMQLMMHIVTLPRRRLFVQFMGKTLLPPSSWRIEKDAEGHPCVQQSSTYPPPVDGEDAEDRLKEPRLVEYQQRLANILYKTHTFIHQHQQEIAARIKARVDARRREPHLQKDDLVLVSAKIYPGREVNRKQAPKFYSPFILGDARGPNAFEVLGLLSSMHSTINVSYLKRV